MNNNPFDHNKFIGYVSKVTPELTRIHFPNSKLLKRFYYDGDVLHSGIVRSYVVIEGEGYGFLGKIVSIELPEKERMSLNESAFQNSEFHPIGLVEIQLAFDIYEKNKVKKGLDQYPPVGAKVYSCSPGYLQSFLKDFGKDINEKEKTDDLLNIAELPQDSGYQISISANSLFGRHCAIVGTTGGGKSYTVAKIIEEMLRKESNIKIILLDSTGEYNSLEKNNKAISFNFGKGGNGYVSYKDLTESDLFALFRPSGQVQVPVLQSSIKSLKLAEILKRKRDTNYSFYNDGLILKKEGSKKIDFDQKTNQYLTDIESETANFDIEKLTAQIGNECIYEDGFNANRQKDTSIWGGSNPSQLEHASSLIMRIKTKIFNSDFSECFGLNKNTRKNKKSFDKIFDDFYKGDKNLLKLNIRKVGFEENLREILTNSIGRYFLSYLQENEDGFKDKPIVFFIDEAHQLFHIDRIKDEYSNEFRLDAFERIAKETRKQGLFLCLSTQRPRDIPQGVLSQMGTFIAHRLINTNDREAIENASPEGSKYLLSFLPSLGQGEALLIGVDFPMPVNLKIKKVSEKNKPNSDTPKLFKI